MGICCKSVFNKLVILKSLFNDSGESLFLHVSLYSLNIVVRLVLELSYNQLNGSVPPEIGNLQMLKWLDLSFNQLSGNLPVQLANAPQLKVLDIRNNTLSGVVPPCKLAPNHHLFHALVL